MSEGGAFDKKKLAKATQDFNLHCLLVQRQDSVAKSAAVAVAYYEGAAGLARRLSPASQG